DLDVLGEIVPLLADDRYLPGLRQQQPAELLELGGRRVAAGEDTEVDSDLEPGRRFVDSKGDGLLDLHRKSYLQASENLTLARLPAELSQRDEDPERSPACEHGDVGGLTPELVPIQIDRVDRIEQVLQRQGVADP